MTTTPTEQPTDVEPVDTDVAAEPEPEARAEAETTTEPEARAEAETTTEPEAGTAHDNGTEPVGAPGPDADGPRPAAPHRTDRVRRPALSRRQQIALAVVAVGLLLARAVVTQHDRDAAHAEVVTATSDRLAAELERQAVERRLDELATRIAGARAATAASKTSAGERRESKATVDAAVASLESELGGLDQQRRSGEQQAVLQIGRTGALRVCLDALDAVQRQLTSDRAVSVDALGASAEPCRQAEAALEGTATASDYTYDFPDPFVLMQGDVAYAFGTNGPGGAVQVLTATGLSGWKLVGNALAGVPIWAQPGRTWAPSVLQVGSTYVMYYTVSDKTSGQQCITAAVASRPQGPYADTSWGPLICQHDLGGSIDASPVRGPDGALYLVWKSERDPAHRNAAHLWGQRLGPDGLTLQGAPGQLLSADRDWERGVIEGPSMMPVGPRWLLLYSANRWDSADYVTAAAWCAGPLGPCTKPADPVVLRSGGDLAGPGGAELFRDRAGAPRVVFHSWAPGAVGFGNSRRFYVGAVTVSPDGRVTITRG